MPPVPAQEKFQITAPPKVDHDDQWKTFESVRTTGEAGFQHSNNANAEAEATAKFNYLPPGMEIANQRRKRFDQMPLVMAGETDVSHDTNPTAMAEGFKRHHLDGADDQYTGEHVDHFYGEAIGDDGNVGFVERNNYLDRE